MLFPSHFKTFATCIALFRLVLAQPSNSSAVEWGPCPDKAPFVNATAQIDCGNISVPLDYTEPNSTHLWDIPLIRVKALRQPSQGTIQINFGGPGYTVIDGLVTRAAVLLQ